MRWNMLWCIWMLAFCLCAGCGERTGNTQETAAVTNERVTSEGELQGVTIRIYHADDMAENICVNTALTEEITPEILVLNLAAYEVLPESVQVESFSLEKEKAANSEQEVRRLFLDLSADFGEYLSSVGTGSEHMIMGSVVNTFLDAYGASSMKVTAGGKTLETGRQVYDDWLEEYDYVQATYSVIDGLLEENGTIFCYPQLQGCSDTELQEKWNSIIEEKVETMAGELGEGASLSGNYEVKTMNDELLSLLLSGEISGAGAAYPSRFQFTYNIDMKTGEGIRLAHYRDVDQIAEDMMNGKNYTVSGELSAEFQARLTVLYGDAAQLAAALRGFDFGKGQEQYPAGYSWQEDGKTWLCMEVPHALGDYVNVELD